MWMRFGVILAQLAMLMHGIFGCCWHHRHASLSSPVAACVPHDLGDCHHLGNFGDSDFHEADGCNSDEKDHGTCGHEHRSDSEHCPGSSRCDEGVCQVVSLPKSAAAAPIELSFAAPDFLPVPAAVLLGMPEQRSASNSFFRSPSKQTRRRALLQFWLI